MRKKLQGQGAIEMMIITPFLIFFIYVLFANGIRQEATLAAANVNYSDGIGIVRSQANTEVDPASSEYVLMRNNTVASQTESSDDVGLGITDNLWIKGWGGKVLTNHVEPNVSGFSTSNEDESRFIVTYPVSPFVSVFQR